ncbi:MAG: 2-oxo acid dehydrogenase subunit E2 [Kofleriaceae bacterium]|nr:2-oxo acid dehydrogenase subunit E2 [Kofleriaceae bacterium]
MALDPQFGTQYNLALCYDKLGRRASAWGELNELAARDTNPARRADAEKRARALEPRLVRLLIVVKERHPGLKLLRDDSDVTAFMGVATPVDPGKSVLSASAPGFRPWSLEVTLAGEGTVVTVDVPALEPAPAPPPGDGDGGGRDVFRTPVPAPPPVDRGPARRRLGLIVGGSGAVVLGVGAVFGAMAGGAFDEVDMSAIMALRARYKDSFEKQHGVKLGFMSFFVKACCAAARLFPGLNAEVVGDSIVYKKHYDFGIAVSTPRGLVVPVLREVDALSFGGIEAGILALAEKARTGKLALDELLGGTFSITNGGIYGSMMSTPLLNYPQTGILGMHNIVKRAVVVDDQVQVRPMMYVALTYDHRVVDGREAVSFLVAVKDRLEAPERLLLEA